MHTPIAISFATRFLTFRNLFRQGFISIWLVHSVHKIVVTASGYIEKSTHLVNWISPPVSVYCQVFYAFPHLPPAARRKSRSSSFSIFSRLIICSWLSGCVLGRPRGKGAAWRSSTSLRRPHQLCIAYRLIPYWRLRLFTLSPLCHARRMLVFVSSLYLGVPFRPDILKPPVVVFILQQRAFSRNVRFYGGGAEWR